MDLRDQLQRTLGSAYTLERELGGGGMSRVFVATETALARQVVVKVLLPELAVGVSAQRFAREIRLAASLQQANVVPVLAAGETDGLPYYTMPFVNGSSLRDRLTRGDRLGMSEAIGVLRDVARALAYAHERGVVHRDIKPENVLLSGGAAMVTDFGIAKAISAARDADGAERAVTTTFTQAGTAIGTPAYMSPEQISADPHIDHRTDLYSFGCLGYEVLAGQAPFAGHTAQHLLAAHLSAQPAPLGERRPECPPGLARLVMQCLEKEPGRRPESAREIIRVLDTVPASSTAFSRLRNRLSRRQRVAAFVLSTAVLAGAVAVAIGPWRPAGTGPRVDASLAVLPFTNIGGDSTKDLWADGLTDEITTVMARRPSVRLATRTAVDRYRGRRDVDAREVGRVLQVRHVLHGTLWPVGSRLRVQAWLSSADGSEVWSDTFEREARDILATLDSITSGITLAVQRRVLGAAAATPAGTAGSVRGTSDTAAYELYLRGQVLLRARGNGVRRAAELFEEAIARDPRYARAHAALSAALEVLPNFADTTFQEVSTRATAAARRALALDPTLAQAHGSLALASMHALRWAEADSEFRLALTLDPGDASTHMHYGRFLTYTARLDAAVREFGRAKSLDPTSPLIGGWLATDLLLVGRRAEAFTEIDRALELDSTSVPIAFMGASLALARGQTARARALAEIAWRPMGVPRPSPWPAAVAAVYAGLGDREMIGRIWRYTLAAPRSRPFGHSSLAMVALALGDTTRVLEELERASDAREFWPSAPMLISSPLDILRRSARFATLLRRAGLDVTVFTSPTGGRPQ
jgi:TolB-like protein/Tfp pilus assembly protein PilF/tRNA A-37 threonylcarbamoyl transferase component Bud32